MDLDDFAEPEVGVAVAVTAAVCSPKVRKALRKGLVYTLAGFISVGDAAKEAADGVKKSIKGAPKAAEAASQPEADA